MGIKQNENEQIDMIISLHQGDIVENAIMQQKQYLYKTKKDMLNNLIIIEENNAEWTTRAYALDEYITEHPDRLDEWISELIRIATDNDIYIDDILIDAIGNDEKKMFALEARLKYILRECILKL